MKLLISFLILFCARAEEASLRFLENPEINGSGVVLLKDIAALEFLAPEDRDALGNIKVAESYDELKKMSSRDIMRRLKPQLRAYENHCECKLQVTIPHAMVVRSLPGDFAIEKVHTTMERELKKVCADCRYDISPLNIIGGAVPKNYTRWAVDMRPGEWRGPTMVRVYFDDDAFSPLVLQSLIKVNRPVLQLKQNVNMGATVTTGDYDIVMTDVTYERAHYAQVSDLTGREAKRTIGKGSALVLDDLIARNLIRIGQPVSVEVQNAAFSIEMTGIAQRNGKLGDKIPVRLNRTQKSISAEVLSESRVRM